MSRIKLKNLLMLTIAGIVNAFGITIFLSPVRLYDSGISGTSMLLSQKSLMKSARYCPKPLKAV